MAGSKPVTTMALVSSEFTVTVAFGSAENVLPLGPTDVIARKVKPPVLVAVPVSEFVTTTS